MPSYPDIIGVLHETDHDFLTVSLSYGGLHGRVLLPAGAWTVRVNAYASQSSNVGYVARVDGPPSWDYSGVYGCSVAAWVTAPWEHGQGTLQDA